ncbi:MAG: response regulator transcription factor [Thermoguttaceae bacterium]|jgi:DNA-binding NarL/FixJ family response regulator
MVPNSSATPRRHKVLVVDDHPIVRHGLAQLILREPDLEVSGEATNISGALRQVETSLPDVAVIDISLDGDNGIELVEEIKAKWPAVKILVSSIHDERVFAGRALRAGAMGYICKREDLSKIVAAIHQILRGEIYLSPDMTTRLLRRAAVGQSLDRDPVETLSNRELQVFEMIGQGMTTIQIARKLDVSPKTIESHRKQIKAKMNLQNSAQLTRSAFQWVQEGR